MAKTVAESVGNIGSGVIPTSQEITQVGGVTPEQNQAGDAISRDIASIMGTGGDLVQMDNTLSVNAAKRIAVDNLSQMSKDLDSIKANATPDMDKREIQKANAAVYQFYGNQIFDNEDAQRQFDDMYHINGANTISKINTALEIEQNQIDADNMFKAGGNDVEFLARAGVQLSNDVMNTLVESMTAGGYYTKEQAEWYLADRSTTAFESKITTNVRNVLTEAGYDMEIGWTNEQAKKVFDNEFGGYGTFNAETGEIEWKPNLENKAQEEILRSWRAFESGMSTTDDGALDPYKRLKNSMGNIMGDAAGGYVSSKELKRNLSQDKAEALRIGSTLPATANQTDNMGIRIQEYQNQITLTSIVERDLGMGGAIDGNLARGYLKDGRTVKVYDALLGQERTMDIKASSYQAAAKSFLNDGSRSALGAKMDTPEDRAAYEANVLNVKELEAVTGMTSALTSKYDEINESGKVQSFSSKRELRQLVGYNNVALAWDKNNEVLKRTNQAVGDIIDNDLLTDGQQVSETNILVQGEKNNQSRAMQVKETRAYMVKKVNESASGEGILTFEASINQSVSTAMMKAIYQGDKHDIAENYIDNQLDSRMMDVGSSLFGDKDQRFIIPDGMGEKDTRKSINAIIKDTNKNYNTFFKEEDLVIHNDFKNGNYTIDIYLKGDAAHGRGGRKIGVITDKNVYMLAEKGK